MFTSGLPVEVWGRIFQESIESDVCNLSTLLSVNHTWRQMIKETASCWTRLVLRCPDHRSVHSNTRLFFELSRLQSLHVVVSLPRAVNFFIEGSNLSRVIVLLRQHLTRFKVLDIQAFMQCDAAKFFINLGCGEYAPTLEHLSITVDIFVPRNSSAYLSFCNVFISSPRLTQLTLPAHAIPMYAHLSLFSTVTALCIDALDPFHEDFPIFAISSFLTSLPQLRHFQYRGIYLTKRLGRFTGLTTIPMPNLVAAEISVAGSGFDILRLIEAPLLTDVHLTARHFRQSGRLIQGTLSCTEYVSKTLRHLSQCSPLVKCLEISQIPSGGWPWLFTEQAFPKLEVVRINAVDFSSVVTKPGVSVMPSLTRLELNACTGNSETALLSFLEGYGPDFELQIRNCPLSTEGRISKLSHVVKVIPSSRIA